MGATKTVQYVSPISTQSYFLAPIFLVHLLLVQANIIASACLTPVLKERYMAGGTSIVPLFAHETCL